MKRTVSPWDYVAPVSFKPRYPAQGVGKISKADTKRLLQLCETAAQKALMGFFTDHFGAFVIPDPVYSKPTARRIFNARPHIVKIRRAIEGSGFEIVNSRGNGYALVRVEK